MTRLQGAPPRPLTWEVHYLLRIGPVVLRRRDSDFQVLAGEELCVLDV